MRKTVMAYGLGYSVLAFCVGTGCVNIRTSDGGNIRSVPVVWCPDYKAEMKVGENQVSGTAFGKTLFGLINWGTYNGTAEFANGSVIQRAAFYDACKKSGADSLIGARYENDKYTWLFSIYTKETITVKGFPAQITGVTPLSVDEAKVYRAERPAELPSVRCKKMFGLFE